MKTALTLEQLAAKLTEQRNAKRDYLADTRTVTMSKDAKALVLADKGKMVIRPFAHRQLAEKLEIPTKFYDRLAANHPDILASTVNALFEREPSENMIRTLDNQVRAVVSTKFRALDNYDLAEAALPVLVEQGCTVESCDITETRLYIKAVHPTLRRELPVPAGLKMGVGHNIFLRLIMAAITIRNSEVGDGSLAVEDGVYERDCTNLASFIAAFRQHHVGKRHKTELDVITEIESDTTRKLSDALVWSKLRDRVVQAFDAQNFEAMCAKLVEARADAIPVETGIPTLVELFGAREGLNETERKGFLQHLMGGGELTRYGMQWAATRLAQDMDSYERASELERVGGRIIELPRSDWQSLLKQAA
jgi:hypothetical protein